jgi:Protein of unknown function (DUF3037)
MVEMNSNPFAYQVIRYTPNLIRDEWVNIGVVIHDPAEGKFRVRLIEEEAEYARVRRLHPAANETLLRGVGPMLEESLRDHSGNLPEWIGKLDRTLSNAVQFSPQTGLLADDLDAELDRLYSNHVAPPRARTATAGVAETRSGIRAGANQVFRIAGLWPKLERSVRVDKFTYSGDPLRLDYSYRRNGTQGFIHSLALTRDPAQAKVLAYTADAIRGKFEKTEFIAITEVEPHPEGNDRHKFVTGLFEKEKIQIVPLSKLPAWSHQMRPQVH